MDRSVKIMEKWIRLEHASGGVTSLVIEGYAPGEIAGSVGVRTADSREDILARGLWRTLTRNLGFPRALWATTLLSYPRYSSISSEAYIERLVVSPDFRRQGMARRLLSAAERKSTRLNSSHANISYAVFCLKKINVVYDAAY